jgi:imidazolonepropionase-like amidohydrolase
MARGRGSGFSPGRRSAPSIICRQYGGASRHALCCRAEAASDVHATWFRKALDAGVRMALGSDIRPLKDAARLEMGLWVRDGATPWQTLVAATRDGAAVCGVGADLGTVEAGKLADLIVVAANPLEDITNVRRLQPVLKEGRVVSDKRHLSGEVP